MTIPLGMVRTTCDCKLCQIACKLIPGYLIPSDLDVMPKGNELLPWARTHLRASPGFMLGSSAPGMEEVTVRLGTLVPARNALGACHWYVEGKCQVHDVAPFACAYFDEHQSHAEARKRRQVGMLEVRDDYMANGPYRQLWELLWSEGLRGPEIIDSKRTFEATVKKFREQEARAKRRQKRKRRK